MKNVGKLVIHRVKKITYFEWLVLFLVAFVAIFVVKYFGKSNQWRTVRIQVIGKDWTNTYGNPIRPPFWLSDKVYVGDVERDASGQTIAEITNVEKTEMFDKATIFLTARIKTKVNKRMNKYMYKGKAVEVGALIELRLSSALITGQIVDDQVPESGYETKKVVVKGRVRGVEPWYVAQVNPGDVMLDRGSNRPIAKILSTTITFPTANTLIKQQDDVFTVEMSPTKKDLVITAELTINKFDHQWYFAGDQKVKVGQFIHIFLENVDLIWVWIEDIRDVSP